MNTIILLILLLINPPFFEGKMLSKEDLKTQSNNIKDKDKDNDGIIDKFDECPRTPGPIENDGCPWEDIDGDNILDNVDGCPEEKGPKKNNGCPWLDTDGDGVLDKDDRCINIPGKVNSDGCPEYEPVIQPKSNVKIPRDEISNKVIDILNKYAKTILFDSGKSKIKDELEQNLNEIIKILKLYPSAKFTIEGHTDNIGVTNLNQKLSEERAHTVMNFFITSGLHSSRFSAIGYGENKPIENNTLEENRSKNRRVEIKLIK